MTILTRSALCSGDYLGRIGLPIERVWTRENIEKSLAATLADRPAGDVWVFAYGSLMWNPLLTFEERKLATLKDWHRSFCLKAVAGRGNPVLPGRMLALEAGAETKGVALRLHEDLLAEELRLLWTREMVAGDYQPVWTSVGLADGRTASAIAFVANTSSPHYDADASVATVAPIISAASGSFGSNAEYVCHLDFALADCGITDHYVEALVAELKLLSASAPPLTRTQAP